MAGMRKFGTITTISKFLLVDVQVIRSLAHVQNQNISKSGIPHSHVTSTTITSCKKILGHLGKNTLLQSLSPALHVR
jgi:hypothetical protein